MKKKFLSMTLAFVMVLSLAACSSGNTEKPVEQATQGQGAEVEKPTEAPVVTPTEETEVTTTPEPTTEPTADESSFDTSWASNDYEKLIPEPPFQDVGWECIYEDDNEYEIFAMDVAPYGGDEYYKEMEDYMRSLEQYGYVILEGEYDRFTAKSVDGSVLVNSRCSEGAAAISITLLH